MKTCKYNIIGDIHAKACWHDLVREDSINIFVGDYFDPYEHTSRAAQLYNFQDILAFKRQRPETVLLYGNHDFHYMVPGEHYSRYDMLGAVEYRQAFEQSQELFYGIAYPIGETALVTHAGVSKPWYEKYIGTYQSESLTEVAQRINQLWETDKQAFAFESNAESYDYCGTTPTHSPIWIRPWVLVKNDLFADTKIKQIIGHTRTEAGVMFDHNLVEVDCLDTKEQSYQLQVTLQDE